MIEDDHNEYASRCQCAIIRFDRKPVPWARKLAIIDLPALERMFAEAGMKHISAREAVTVREGMREVAYDLGYLDGMVFPPVEWIDRFLAVISMHDFLRGLVNSPIGIRYVYRPPDLQAICNKESPDSDHVHCLACDSEWASVAVRDAVLEFVQTMQAREKWLRISYGWKPGSKVLHAGLLTSNGARSWRY